MYTLEMDSNYDYHCIYPLFFGSELHTTQQAQNYLTTPFKSIFPKDHLTENVVIKSTSAKTKGPLSSKQFIFVKNKQ